MKRYIIALTLFVSALAGVGANAREVYSLNDGWLFSSNRSSTATVRVT